MLIYIGCWNRYIYNFTTSKFSILSMVKMKGIFEPLTLPEWGTWARPLNIDHTSLVWQLHCPQNWQDNLKAAWITYMTKNYDQTTTLVGWILVMFKFYVAWWSGDMAIFAGQNEVMIPEAGASNTETAGWGKYSQRLCFLPAVGLTNRERAEVDRQPIGRRHLDNKT